MSARFPAVAPPASWPARAQSTGRYLARTQYNEIPPRIELAADELPRLPTGKLYKRLLRDRYWADSKSRIV